MIAHRNSLSLFALIGALLVSGFLTGCTDVPKRTGDLHTDLRSSDPLIRGESALYAGETRAESTVPLLIELLEDDEYGVRLNAHISLILITGRNDFGYQALDPPNRRAESAAKWRKWYKTIDPT